MFLFVVGMLLAPLIGYLLCAYIRIGKGIFRGVFDKTKTIQSRALTGLLASLFHLIPFILIIPLTDSAALTSGLLIGLIMVFLFTRKRQTDENSEL